MTRLLPILILFCILYSLFFISSSFAQEISPTVTSSPQINTQAVNAWEDFKSFFIPDTLGKVNCANLPLEVCTGIKPADSKVRKDGINTPVNTQAAEDKTDNKETSANAAGQYVIASGIYTPPEVANASTNIILDFFASIADAIGSIFNRGEKQAKNYAGTVLPESVKDQNFAQRVENISDFAYANPNVLGAQLQISAMDKSLPLMQCSQLPAELCKDNKPIGFTASDPQTSTPPPSGYPIISLPPGCGQEDSSSEGYTGNSCQLVTSGWCAISCLKQFTEGNIETAARLSQICMLESGGNPAAGPNTGCLKGTTQEYSVGLFQINLIDRCSGGILDEWAERKICTILDENIFNQCVADMENPIQNINKAYSLTNGGRNWNSWKIASERCGFIDTIENKPR